MHTSLLTVEERLRIATAAAHIGVWEWDVPSGTMEYSAVAKEIFGFAPDAEITFAMVQAVTHPDDFPNTSAAAARALDPEIRENVIFRYRFIRADTSEVRWGLAYGEALFPPEGGAATRYIGTIQDITEQKAAEDALLESEARLKLAIEIGQMAVWEVDLERGTVTGSEQLNRLCGFPVDARPTLEDFNARYAPGELDRIQREAAAVTERGENHIQTEARFLWPDRTERELLLRAQVAPTATGTGQRVIGVLIDITERKRMERELALVARELLHRVKNSLAVVGSVARGTFSAEPAAKPALERFMARLQVMGKSTELLAAGDTETVALADLVASAIEPYRTANAETFRVSGSGVTLSGKSVTAVAMALHELATNAVKYGALSGPTGLVSISWAAASDHLTIQWRETGGPHVQPPAKAGFGTTLLTRALVNRPDKIDLRYEPTGLECDILLYNDDMSV